ncbi:hypothetical protein ACOME3_009645 [Neoechinorhynchus agilis]
MEKQETRTVLKSMLRNKLPKDNTRFWAGNRRPMKTVAISPIIAVRSFKTDGQTTDSLDYLKLNKDTRCTNWLRRRHHRFNPARESNSAVENQLNASHCFVLNRPYLEALQDTQNVNAVFERLSTKYIEFDETNKARLSAHLTSSLRRIEKRGSRRFREIVQPKEIDPDTLGDFVRFRRRKFLQRWDLYNNLSSDIQNVFIMHKSSHRKPGYLEEIELVDNMPEYAYSNRRMEVSNISSKKETSRKIIPQSGQIIRNERL